MRSLKIMTVLSLGLWALFGSANPSTVAARGDDKIELLDDCDPSLAGGWNTATDQTQCIREEGSVTRFEFGPLGGFQLSPLSLAVVGHPSWTIAPAFSTPELGERLRVRNAGGRGHTFTEVTNFGGGFVPPLNTGLTPALECLAATGAVIAPGGRITLQGLALGNHKFQCCIHPWMRAVVKVVPSDDDDDDD